MSFEEYYKEQSGSGLQSGTLWQEGGSIRGYAGRPYQYGNGFGSFGRKLYRWAKPLLKYLGKEALQTGVNIGSDVLSGGDIKESVSNRLHETGAQIADDAVAVVKKKIRQKGKGMARRRRRPRKQNKRPVLRKRRPVRRRRRTRRRVKKSLTDIFA